MGRTRKLLALTTLAAVALPPLAAAIVRSRYEVSAEDDDHLRVASIFEGGPVRATSPALRRGEALAWYGALDLDLRGAALDPGGARLRVVALFAGARVIVPTGWDVRVRPIGVFGGVDARVAPPVEAGPQLIIDAIAVFAGVQVTDRPAEDEPDVTLEPPPAGRPQPSGDAPARGGDSGTDAADASALEFERAEAEARREAVASEPMASDGPGGDEPQG